MTAALLLLLAASDALRSLFAMECSVFCWGSQGFFFDEGPVCCNYCHCCWRDTWSHLELCVLVAGFRVRILSYLVLDRSLLLLLPLLVLLLSLFSLLLLLLLGFGCREAAGASVCVTALFVF